MEARSRSSVPHERVRVVRFRRARLQCPLNTRQYMRQEELVLHTRRQGTTVVVTWTLSTHLPCLDAVPEARVEAPSGDPAWGYASAALLEPGFGWDV